MKFSYKAQEKNGTIIEGFIEAVNETAVLDQFHKEGILLLRLKEVHTTAFSLPGMSRVGLHEKIIFLKNMSGMLGAGVALSRSLEIIEHQTTHPVFKKIITEVRTAIIEGSTFSDALEKHVPIFPNLMIAMVKAGEESGTLVESLQQVATTLEKEYALRRKIKSALMYPAIIIGVIVLIGILMMLFVVPTLVATFKDLGAELPKSTQFVIWISDTLQQHTILFFVALLSIGGAIYAGFKSPRVRPFFEKAILRLPVISTLVKESNTARISRTLSSLLQSGVPLARSIEIVGVVVQHGLYKESLREAQKRVLQGAPLSGVFQENTHLYPVMMGEMIEVGEETGKVSSMLFDVALFYEAEVEAKTKDLSTIIEPVLMVFIGAAVGFFAISMLQPMYSVMETIQ